VQHGLVRPGFVPPPEIRRLRDLTRLRKAQINARARSIQRLEKVLQDAGIKLYSVASTTYSKSARAMLEALLAGVSDPEQLAELAKARMRLKIPQLREALASRFQIEHHGVMVAQLLAHIDTLDAAIQNLSERITSVLAPHQHVRENARSGIRPKVLVCRLLATGTPARTIALLLSLPPLPACDRAELCRRAIG
jgi:transposase